MTETKELVFYRGQQTVEVLWALIRKGWSVKKATYSLLKRRFTIVLSEESYPSILIPCSKCGTEFCARDLSFKPYGFGRICYCLVCKNEIDLSERASDEG